MKTNLIFLSVLLFLAGCDDSDDNKSLRKADIDILVNASDTQRLTAIETIVYGTDLELRTNSFSNTHLPHRKIYLNQEIPELSAISVSFRDNSVVPIGAGFKPYTMEIIIKIDDEIALSEQHTVDKQGYAVSANLSLTDYFANK